MSSDEASLTIHGLCVEGWTTVRIMRGMGRIPSDFTNGLTERYPNTTDVIVSDGDPCTLAIGGGTVITG